MAGRLYGKAKIHKTGCPPRLVTSMVNTLEHILAKWFDSLIKPYILDSYFLISTSSFLDKVRELEPTNDDELAKYKEPASRLRVIVRVFPKIKFHFTQQKLTYACRAILPLADFVRIAAISARFEFN